MQCVVFHLDAHRQEIESREHSVRNTHTHSESLQVRFVNIVLVTGTFIRINTVVLIGEFLCVCFSTCFIPVCLLAWIPHLLVG
ncbi:hypothetical protein HanPSC8_Chr11g0471541 [Helianthus annuus]|nr:hypothetical protein HanPSC8_Chr11g0471541 [Helianthus annuus]